jgi:hypothetical protein
MGGRVVQLLDPVAGLRKDRPRRAVHQHGADRHLVAGGGGFRLCERNGHRTGLCHFFHHVPEMTARWADRQCH